MKCEICPDIPPNDAVFQLPGLAVCFECFDELMPDLCDNCLQEMTILTE